MLKVEYFPVNSAVNQVILSAVPTDTASVSVDLVGGTAQALSVDFVVTDNTVVSWTGLGPQFDSTVDTVRVIYDRS
jgi:hypothetical protein